ncbi:ABC transporter ATP-binding protein [Gryllotalpicola koreensis]|uniref:ABC transporter ATP-binding protein n=1 Tax=Gryllotalpicola koreensis TaxID=993086 RepID=A0ABP7ZUI8_9MICO
MTPLPVAAGREVARYAWRVVSRRPWLTLAVAAATVAASVAGLGGPIAVGWIVDGIVSHAGARALIAPIALLAGCAAGGAGATWASGALLAALVLPPVGGLREDVIDAALRLPLDRLEDAGAGDLVSRTTGDVEQVTDAATGALGAFLSAAVTIAVTVVGLGSLDWRFALAGLLAVPIQAWTLRWYLREARPIYAAARAAEGARTATLIEAFGALPAIRALRLRDRALGRITTSSAAAVDVELAATRAATRFYGRLNVAEFVGLGAILLVGYALVRGHAVGIGAATTAALFFAGLFGPVNTVLAVVDQLQQAAAGLGRLLGVTVAAGPPIDEREVAGAVAGGELVARDVSFRYPGGRTVVEGVNLRIERGHRIAVVGATGSGKSTLATLIAGLRVPEAGTVVLGGRSPARLARARRGRAIAAISQEAHVFAGTVADNLRLADPTATDAHLRGCLVAVGADAWVDRLPEGLETIVGAGGRALSRHEAQHLALARALLLDPAFVILDEATAEAGSGDARILDEAARVVMRGRGALIIAHRLDQAASADEILVMSEGRIVERGAHAQLLAAGGGYHRLWSAWADGRIQLR